MLCGFALTIPFELALEVFFGIDTQLKLFRIFVLAALTGFGVKLLYGGFRNLKFWDDLPLYAVFTYGLLISFYQMFHPGFLQPIFNSDLIQILLNLGIFFVIKNAKLTLEQWNKILWFLTIGVFGNCLFIFYQFTVFRIFGRDGGLMDNPNYVSLSIVVAAAFLFYRISNTKKWLPKLISIGMLLFILFVFPSTGSRTGLLLLVVMLLLLFIFANIRTKIIAVGVVGLLSLFWIPQNLDKLNVGASFVLTKRISKKVGEEDVRIPIWKGALNAGADAYFIGLGIGQFKSKFTKIFHDEHHPTILKVVDRGFFLSTHSDYVSLLVVYGIVGLFLYLFYITKIVVYLLKKIKVSKTKKVLRFYQLNFILLVCIIIFGIGSENFLSPIYWILLAMSTSSLSVIFRNQKNPKAQLTT